MFQWIHLLKQVQPVALSAALIKALQNRAKAVGIDADDFLHRPLPDAGLADTHRALIRLHAALRQRPTSVEETGQAASTASELQAFLNVLHRYKIMPITRLQAQEVMTQCPSSRIPTLEIKIESSPALEFSQYSADGMMITTYPDFALIALNPVCRKWLALADSDVSGTAWPDYVHPQDWGKTFTALQSLLEERHLTARYQNRWRVAATSITPELVYRLIEWTMTRHDHQVYAIGRELAQPSINPRHQTEIKEKEMTAILFHELRNPLNGILGNAQLIRSRIDELLIAIEENTDHSHLQLNLPVLMDELTRIRKKIKTMELCGQDQLVILNDVLDFHKLEQKQVALEVKPFRMLRDVLNPLLDTYRPISEEKSIILLTAFPHEDLRLRGDAYRLKQILTNLLTNALKFAAPFAEQPAQVEFSLTVQSQNQQRCLHFKIKNTGAVLSSTQIAKLFKPYVQSDVSITRRFGGTGLGLVVCKQLVDKMQGKITCTSSLEARWVQFEVMLTLSTIEQSHQSLAKKVKKSTQRARIKTVLNAYVLVAEDNQINQKVLRRMLKKYGCTVDVVENGQQAVQFCAKHFYSLILMDMQMPVMDGLAATRQIRDKEKSSGDPVLLPVPIIGLSANALREQEQQALAAGMNGYLTKPILEKTLFQTIVQHQRPLSTPQTPATPTVLRDQKSVKRSLFSASHSGFSRHRSPSPFLSSSRPKLAKQIRSEPLLTADDSWRSPTPEVDSEEDSLSLSRSGCSGFFLENPEITSLKQKVTQLEKRLQNSGPPRSSQPVVNITVSSCQPAVVLTPFPFTSSSLTSHPEEEFSSDTASETLHSTAPNRNEEGDSLGWSRLAEPLEPTTLSDSPISHLRQHTVDSPLLQGITASIDPPSLPGTPRKKRSTDKTDQDGKEWTIDRHLSLPQPMLANAKLLQAFREAKENPIKQAQVALQAIDHYFRKALIEQLSLTPLSRKISLPAQEEMKHWIKRLNAAYEKTSTPKQQPLIVALAVGCWQLLQPLSVEAGHAILEKIATTHLKIWQQRLEQLQEAKPTHCCVMM